MKDKKGLLTKNGRDRGKTAQSWDTFYIRVIHSHTIFVLLNFESHWPSMTTLPSFLNSTERSQ